ncbi:MAG TPA: HNH endonuclease signature motif containing protein, partial [Acidimicrobiales bacterium]|nr:HNH endonuclease signature motif containing protein [Acidimicrobiales bacterium]
APGGADLSSGATVGGDAARRLACDAGVHRIVVKGTSEILDVGQKTRTATVAQRRSIKSRHGHRCAYPGCERRIFQIHHIVWWENCGATAVDNGVPLCLAHHHLVHEGGWTVSYEPTTGVTTFTGPDGQQTTSHDRPRCAT